MINNVHDIAYQHFNQPDHWILSMPLRIIEKIYHRTNNLNLATPLRIQEEDYWIRELETATPYGCNDKIDGIGILSSPTCRSMNVMDIFNSAPRRKPIQSSLKQIIIEKPEGSMSTRSMSIFKEPNVAKHMSLLHDNYCIVSADKAPNNIVVCVNHIT